MRRLIVDIYCIIFRFTRSKPLSVGVAVVYMTVLNLIMIQGLALLMEGWLSVMYVARRLFAFPFYIIVAAVVLGVTYWLMPPVSIMSKEYKKKDSNPWPLVGYTVFTLLLFIYIRIWR